MVDGMTTAQTTEYLNYIRTLETSVYMQNQLTAILDRHRVDSEQAIKNAQNEVLPPAPQLEQETLRSRIIGGLLFPEIAVFHGTSGVISFFFRLIAWFYGHYLLGGLLLTLLSYLMPLAEWFARWFGDSQAGVVFRFSAVWRALWHGGNTQLFVDCLIAGLFAAHLASLLIYTLTLKKDNAREKSNFNTALEDYRQLEAEREERVRQREAYYARLLEWMVACYTAKRDTMEVLNRLYALDVLYPKYRNLIAVCTMYEYFESGRCAVLTGHEGAYNLYESELCMSQIIGKLDEISDKLDQIRENQQLLASAIEESARQTQSMLGRIDQSLQKVQVSAEAAAYQAEVTARNTKYIAYLETANYLRS